MIWLVNLVFCVVGGVLLGVAFDDWMVGVGAVILAMYVRPDK